MSASETLLVYNRIDVNRRNTRLLLAVFAVLLLPFAYSLAQVLPFTYRVAHVLIDVLRSKPADITPTEIISVTTLALLAFVSAVMFACFGNAFISSFLFWRADARRACRENEPDLFRMVENLSIGAGLPPPTLYIVESMEPNAFTTGSDPEHASLVINRGLLRLLDERELAGVVAHELSHIGNHDTDFSTMLAALVETMRFPLRVVKGIGRLISLWDDFSNRSIDPAAVAPVVLVVLILMMAAGDGDLADVLGVGWNLRTLVVLAAPVYVFILAPGCATLLRATMSQERDFLADADAALLTRDPEGLALALAKVGGAIHFTSTADAATAHLYFVDPLPDASWWNTYRTHPPIDARIALLAKMGDGIPEAELRHAAATGAEFQESPPLVDAATHSMSPRIAGRETAMCEPGARVRLTDSRTLLYKAADRSSAVLAELDSNVPATIVNLEPQFIHVRLVDGTVGYIRLFAGRTPFEDDLDGNQTASRPESNGIHYRRLSPVVAAQHDVSETAFQLPGTQFRLTDRSTPLYARPDGWSDVLQEISSGTVVTFHELVGRFARVATDRTVGYISTSTKIVKVDAA